MNRGRADNDIVAPLPGTQHRCLGCGGIIEISSDQDVSAGLNLALGLVSDECALICDGCASRLIAEKQVQKRVVQRRR